MAENSTRAFGRYLRLLRERRKLSLDDVASLSQTFPEKTNKGYLSRCENGHQRLAFSKVIALSRIYEVPADVLVERMELDLEVDRIGPPDTESLSYAELTDAGRAALREGFFIKAYGFLRDAVLRATSDPVRPSFRDSSEQFAIAQMSCGTAARSLGRHKYALHEFLHLEATGSFGPKFYPIILERISGCYRALKDFDAAESYADAAITKAEKYGDSEYLGYVFDNRAFVAVAQSELDMAISFYHKAHTAHKGENRTIECAITLNNLSQCYFDIKRYGAARRTCQASARISRKNDLHRSLALSLIMLGEIDVVENRPANALRKWKEAVEIAKKLDDKELRFKTEFVLFKRALSHGELAAARAIKRRLRRLSPWIPADTYELDQFKQLISDQVEQ